MTEHRASRMAWLPSGVHHLLLDGYSGAGIALVEGTRGVRFIRKIAGSPGDSRRLRCQAERQAAYASRVDLVRVPRVLADGEFEGRFYFDMEVIDGFDAATYLRTSSLDAVAAVSDTLSRLVRRSADQSSIIESSSGLRESLEAKLDELRQRLAGDGSSTSAVLDRLEKLIAEAPVELMPTLCHGDMTLDNILIDRRGTLWVVDLTPPPFEHVWFDVAKLLQDLDGGWYLRAGRPMSAGVRSYVLAAVLRAADATGFAEHRQLLVGLTFARILPYVRSHDDRRFVLARLSSVLAMPELQEVGERCS